MINQPGTYRLATISDDGSELEIENAVVVQNGGQHGPQRAVGQATLDRGVHPIRIRYEQAGGRFALEVSYAPPGKELMPIPASALLPDPISYPQYRTRQLAPIAGAVIALLLWMVPRTFSRGEALPVGRHQSLGLLPIAPQSRSRPWVVAYFRHFQLPMTLIAAFALFGAVSYGSSRARTAGGLLITFTAAYFTLLPAVAQSPQDRYRLPVDGLLLVLGCYGAAALVRQLFGRREGDAA